MLKIGAAAGAAGVLAPSMLTSNEALGFQAVAEPVTLRTTIRAPVHHIILLWMNSRLRFLRMTIR